MVAVLRLLATMRLSRFGARNDRLSRGIYSYTPCLLTCQGPTGTGAGALDRTANLKRDVDHPQA